MKRAAATELALTPHATAMRFDEPLRDVQAQTEAAAILGNLLEFLEDALKRVFGNARARILHGETQVISFTRDVDRDPPAGWRELEGVTDQVGQHFEDAPGVEAADAWR